jgi:hypothetical protein
LIIEIYKYLINDEDNNYKIVYINDYKYLFDANDSIFTYNDQCNEYTINNSESISTVYNIYICKDYTNYLIGADNIEIIKQYNYNTFKCKINNSTDNTIYECIKISDDQYIKKENLTQITTYYDTKIIKTYNFIYGTMNFDLNNNKLKNDVLIKINSFVINDIDNIYKMTYLCRIGLLYLDLLEDYSTTCEINGIRRTKTCLKYICEKIYNYINGNNQKILTLNENKIKNGSMSGGLLIYKEKKTGIDENDISKKIEEIIEKIIFKNGKNNDVKSNQSTKWKNCWPDGFCYNLKSDK